MHQTMTVGGRPRLVTRQSTSRQNDNTHQVLPQAGCNMPMVPWDHWPSQRTEGRYSSKLQPRCVTVNKIRKRCARRTAGCERSNYQGTDSSMVLLEHVSDRDGRMRDSDLPSHGAKGGRASRSSRTC